MFATYLVTLTILLCVFINGRSVGAQFFSPCPEIFSYKYDSQQGWYGEIHAHPPYGTFRIDLTLIATRILSDNYSGKIVIAHSNSDVFRRLEQSQELTFFVIFPLQNPLPVLTSLQFNNEVVCSSDDSIFSSAREKTTFNLGYTLQTAVPFGQTLRIPMNNQQQFRQTSTTTRPIRPIDNPVEDICGISKPATSLLIVDGLPYSRGEWPWLIAVNSLIDSQYKFICGATLISKSAAITAAHCLFSGKLGRQLNVDEIYLEIGRYNRADSHETDTQTLNPSKIIAHESYDFYSLLKRGETPKDADIGLLILEHNIVFNQYIKPACLDRSAQQSTAQTGIVVGWGQNENHAITQTPNQVKVTLVSERDCVFEDDTFRQLLSNRTFCAGDKSGKGPCMGDSGGGLVVLNNGLWMLRGIVSTSILDGNYFCDVKKYAVYTDVNKYISWIDRNLKK